MKKLKRLLYLLTNSLLALLLLMFCLPVILLLGLLIKLEDGGSVFFIQRRLGKSGKIFRMYKMRTMVKGADRLKDKYIHLNEADGPVFKIYKDPRHTKIGRFMAWTGLDELPQLINIIKGEMAFVGPRPLPVKEAEKVPLKYKKRFSILPGITSTWVISGSHNLSFKQWMELDLEYIEKKSFWFDVKIIFLTVNLVVKWSAGRFLGTQ